MKRWHNTALGWALAGSMLAGCGEASPHQPSQPPELTTTDTISSSVPTTTENALPPLDSTVYAPPLVLNPSQANTVVNAAKHLYDVAPLAGRFEDNNPPTTYSVRVGIGSSAVSASMFQVSYSENDLVGPWAVDISYEGGNGAPAFSFELDRPPVQNEGADWSFYCGGDGAAAPEVTGGQEQNSNTLAPPNGMTSQQYDTHVLVNAAQLINSFAKAAAGNGQFAAPTNPCL